MDYTAIDTDARAKALSMATGEGDLSALTTDDAAGAEHTAVVLALRAALLAAHAASDDPDAANFVNARDALSDAADRARVIADKIVAAAGADVSAIRPAILAMNLAKAEADHFDADWKLTNLPDETPEQTADLELTRARAAREIAVLMKGNT
jgi:hypothetical protein